MYFRCRGPVNQYNKQTQHIRGHTVLDGAGGHKAVMLRQQGGHLVARHHGHRAGQGRAAQLRAAPHEGAVPHTQEQPPAAHGELLEAVQRVRRSVPK